MTEQHFVIRDGELKPIEDEFDEVIGYLNDIAAALGLWNVKGPEIVEAVQKLAAARQQAQGALWDAHGQTHGDHRSVMPPRDIEAKPKADAARQQADAAQYERETNEANYEDWSE